ncbi:unnamed protein product [Durusdinium trenchii]|uniref:Ubiquitin-like domain-containing protein n=1 Tax=Durusdinium trenchii TaxID=1381693 RepID=A0ABP0QCQ2_9DINO
MAQPMSSDVFVLGLLPIEVEEKEAEEKEEEKKDEEMPEEKAEDIDDDDEEPEKIEEPHASNEKLHWPQKIGSDSESEKGRLEAPGDAIGALEISEAWFGSPSDAAQRCDVTAAVRAAGAAGAVRATAAALGVASGGGRRKLWVSCSYRWLDEDAAQMCRQLAEKAGEEVRVEDPRLLQLHRLLSEPLGPLKKAMVEQQLQTLRLQLCASLALDGLLCLAQRRTQTFARAAAAVATHGFPFAYVACRAAQGLAAALRFGGSGGSGVDAGSASRAEVREFLTPCARRGERLVFERLFGEFFKHVHGEWLHLGDARSIEELNELVKVAQEEMLELLSRHAKEPRPSAEEQTLRAEALHAATALGFCVLCLRPLQQFPDEVGALVDAKDQRLESALYHRRCAFHTAEGWRGCCAALNAHVLAPGLNVPPLLLQPTAVAQGWWAMPPLMKVNEWARFVASGASAGAPSAAGDAQVPVEQVAVALSAALPVHAQQLLRQLGRGPLGSERSGIVQDLESLECIARWTLRTLATLHWAPKALSPEASLEGWSSWFCSWDALQEGSLSRGTLALALGAAVRAQADLHHVVLADPLEEVLPLLCSEMGELETISLARFLGDVAAAASELLRRHLSPRPAESVAATPPPEAPEERRSSRGAAEELVPLSFIGLCGRRRVAYVAPELPLQLKALVTGLAGDSLGFALAQEALDSDGLMRFFWAGRELPQEGPATLRDLGLFGGSAVLVLTCHPGGTGMAELFWGGGSWR